MCSMKTLSNIVVILFGISFVVMAIIMLQSCDTLTDIRLFVCWVSIFFFGSGTLFMLFHMLRPRKQAPIDRNQHYLTIAYGFYRREIEWKHITGFSTYSYQGTDWVLVHVDNVDELVASTRNWFRCMSLRLTLNQFGAPYAIAAERLTQTPQQLCEELNQELERRKATSTRI